jgi:hypothetical protein
MENSDMSTAGNESTAEFDDFVSAGKVEVGSEVAAEKEAAEEPERRNPPKTKAEPESDDAGDDDQQEDEIEAADNSADDTDDDEGEEEPEPKKKRQPSDRIRELTKKLRDRDRLLESLASRLENLETGGLPTGNQGGNQSSELAEPDPSDTDKYPLGHLDDRYIEEKLEWLAEKKATERADAVLLRQQAYEQNQAAEKQQQELLVKVDDLATRGSDIFDDFQENVVEAGMRGDWDLSQATFEAAHESENGAQILYELSQNKAEASRVAKLSPFQQLKFVQVRDMELSKGKQPRKVPQAGEPPRNTARGANSRTHISPATENLDDFEKAWEADAKKGHS